MKVKSETLISEIPIKNNYQKLRATKIEYENSDMPHIDLRIMQYAELKDGTQTYIYTTKGFRVLEKDFRKFLSDIKSY